MSTYAQQRGEKIVVRLTDRSFRERCKSKDTRYPDYTHNRYYEEKPSCDDRDIQQVVVEFCELQKETRISNRGRKGQVRCDSSSKVRKRTLFFGISPSANAR